VDHRYIDEQAIAERYLRHSLLPRERTEFEAHLIDCQECADRVLLAEMFQVRNGAPRARPSISQQPVLDPYASLPLRARVIARYPPWALVLIFAIAGLLLLLVPTAMFLWELHSRGR
jgi:anti-sigma factor RsiW